MEVRVPACYTSLSDDLMSLLQSRLVDGSTKYFFNPSLLRPTPLTWLDSRSATPHCPLSSPTHSRLSAKCG